MSHADGGSGGLGTDAAPRMFFLLFLVFFVKMGIFVDEQPTVPMLTLLVTHYRFKSDSENRFILNVIIYFECLKTDLEPAVITSCGAVI